jgi:predicted restriction endonuclease
VGDVPSDIGIAALCLPSAPYQSAHIRPYGKDGLHELSNDLLLRSDLHKLFDLGYMTVDPERRPS